VLILIFVAVVYQSVPREIPDIIIRFLAADERMRVRALQRLRSSTPLVWFELPA